MTQISKAAWIVIIVFAALLLLFGYTLTQNFGEASIMRLSTSLEKKIDEKIDARLQNVEAMIDAKVSEKLKERFDSEKGTGNVSLSNLEAAIDEGIARYVKKAEEAQKKQQEEESKPKKIEGVSPDDDAVLGNKNAPITIVEFTDYQCPYCERHFSETFPQLKKEYIDTGKVKLIVRDFPLNFHQNAMDAAIAAECAGDEGDAKYFEMHHKLFENQNALAVNDLKKYAKEIGLNESRFNTCLDTQKYKSEVEKDLKDGQKYGVSGTPGFFINGWFLRGAMPFASFQQIIDQELNKK